MKQNVHRWIKGAGWNKKLSFFPLSIFLSIITCPLKLETNAMSFPASFSGPKSKKIMLEPSRAVYCA